VACARPQGRGQWLADADGAIAVAMAHDEGAVIDAIAELAITHADPAVLCAAAAFSTAIAATITTRRRNAMVEVARRARDGGRALRARGPASSA
jgi:hypothetical protein